MLVAFFVAAVGEKVGWLGHAIDRMPDRWNALQASLLLCIVATGVVIVWIYQSTGLFHAIGNVSWQMFPSRGSHYAPRVASIIAVLAGLIVAVVWGPRTATRAVVTD